MAHHPAVLILSDGTTFYGRSVGAKGTTTGEICFNTGMTGYQEIYTDPSYFGQIIVNTHPHIGNYGVSHLENEADKVMINGVVIKNFSTIYSRFTADSALQKFLEDAGIVGISDVDTRMLVRHIRQMGAMNCVISSEVEQIDHAIEKLKNTPDMNGLELSSVVSTRSAYEIGDPQAPFRVAVLDFGIKKSILQNLASRGVVCRIFPAKTSIAELLAWNPDGFFLSNGPGDPAVMTYAIETVRLILEQKKPVFGICLGHQLLALAVGLKTYKMHHGHRGLNHPVKNLITGRSEVTSQNHGFAVAPEGIEQHPDAEITHINLNDGTIEGIRLKSQKAFSVQYHPEASPGPHDSRYLFDHFVSLMQQG